MLNPSQNFCYSHCLNFHVFGSPESVSKQPTQLIIAAHNCHIYWLMANSSTTSPNLYMVIAEMYFNSIENIRTKYGVTENLDEN